MKDVILGVVGDGVGIGVGAGVKVGVGLGVGVGEGVGVGVGAGEGLEVGSGVGVNEGVGVGEGTGVGVGVGDGVGSGISPLVPLLMLPNIERDDCVSAGLITLTKHTAITIKVLIPRQLHFPFILSIVLSYRRYPVTSTTPSRLSNTNYNADSVTILLVRLQP